MSRQSQKKSVEMEISTLKDLLRRTEDPTGLTGSSLLRRISQLEGELSDLPVEPKLEPETLNVSFRGQPVRGSYGISARFVGDAIGSLVKAVSAIGGSITRGLKGTGQFPGARDFDFMLTSMTRGSVGFKLEHRRPWPQHRLDFGDASPVSEALDRAIQILQASKEDDEERLSEAIADLDLRAVQRVNGFVKRLHVAEATCALSSSRGSVKFDSLSEVWTSHQLLHKSNLRSEEVTFEGRFLGVLPEGRMFEFEMADGRVIRGRIDRSIEEPMRFNDHLRSRARIRAVQARVRSSLSRLTLIDDPEFFEDDGHPF